MRTKLVMHDRDTKFSASFDAILKGVDLQVSLAAHRSANTVAYVERFIQTLQQECVDYFVVFGRQHVDHLISEVVAYYHEERLHQAKDNDPPIPLTKAAPKRGSGKGTRQRPTPCRCHKSPVGSGWADCSSTTTARRHNSLHRLVLPPSSAAVICSEGGVQTGASRIPSRHMTAPGR